MGYGPGWGGVTPGSPEGNLFDNPHPAFPGEIWWPQLDFVLWPLLYLSYA